MFRRKSQSLILDPTDIMQLLKSHGIAVTPEDDVTISLKTADDSIEFDLQDACIVVNLVAEIGVEVIDPEPGFILSMAG